MYVGFFYLIDVTGLIFVNVLVQFHAPEFNLEWK